MELKITLQPKQKIAFEKSSVTPVLFYGGAKGGGKSYLIRARELARRLKYAGSRGLIVRKTHPELLSNHIRKFFEEYPITRSWYNKQEKAIHWPNGSVTEFSYLQTPDDVFTYQGREYEDISIDEITQHEEIVFKVLRTSCRTSNQKLVDEGLVPTMLLTGNPGGIGHLWVKRIFVDRQFKENEHAEDFDFVQAFVQDNKALLQADPDYIRRLSDLPESLRKAYLEGDWNIHAGQAFSELSRHVHIIDPIELPLNTRYFAGYDHGYNHPFSFVLFAVVPDGTVYVVAHITDRLKRPDEIYDQVMPALKDKGKVDIYAGHDLWARGRDGGPTIHEQFYNLGMKPSMGATIVKAKIDRKQGVAEIRKWIAWKGTESKEPKMFFFRNCADVFDVVAGMQFDAKNPEDVLKIDADEDGLGGDDAYDAFRYGVMSRLSAPKERKKEYPEDAGMRILQEHLRKEAVKREVRRWH